RAAAVKARASADLAKADEDIAIKVAKDDPGAVSKLKLVQVREKLKEANAALKQAQAGVDQAQATERQAEDAVKEAEAAQLQAEAKVMEAKAAQRQAEAAERQSEFTLKMAESNVTSVQAQLKDALFNLEQCQVRAPADGFVVDWVVREGSMVVPLVMRPAGAFIEASGTDVVAGRPPNYLMNVKPGNEVEMALAPYPGRLVKGKVENVIEATGEGQFAPGGEIPKASTVGSQGLLTVKIRLSGEDSALKPPLGAGGTVAIYTDEGKIGRASCRER